jgi:hypothetical protein
MTAHPVLWKILFGVLLWWSALTLPGMVEAYQGTWTCPLLVMAVVVMIFISGNRASEGECVRMLRGLVR